MTAAAAVRTLGPAVGGGEGWGQPTPPPLEVARRADRTRGNHRRTKGPLDAEKVAARRVREHRLARPSIRVRTWG